MTKLNVYVFIFTSTHNKCSLTVSVMLCTFISFLSVHHNFSLDDFGYGVSVLPVTLFVRVLCKCTLIIHVECPSTLVTMVLLYTLFP
jgi:hypothetical protein